MIFKHLQLPLSPIMFHCLFQMKMMEPRVFYFTGCPDYQLLRDMPSSHKGMEEFYFFSQLPTPYCILRSGILNSPTLKNANPTAPSHLLCIPSETDIHLLLDDRLLTHFRLSPFIPNDVTLIGSSFSSFMHTPYITLRNINFYEFTFYRRHHVGCNPERPPEVQKEEVG